MQSKRLCRSCHGRILISTTVNSPVGRFQRGVSDQTSEPGGPAADPLAASAASNSSPRRGRSDPYLGPQGGPAAFNPPARWPLAASGGTRHPYPRLRGGWLPGTRSWAGPSSARGVGNVLTGNPDDGGRLAPFPPAGSAGDERVTGGRRHTRADCWRFTRNGIEWMVRQVQAFRRAEFGVPFTGVRLDEEDGRKSSEKCFVRHVRVGIVLDGYVGDVRGRESR